MKIAIIGAGAIGGYIGGMLARAGADVTLLARGRHLDAMRENGLTVEAGGERFTVKPACTDDPAKIGRQDYLLVTLKAPAFPALAPQLAPLLGPDAAVVTAMNGIPYWYFHAHPGAFAGRQLKSIDPDGVLWQTLTPERAIGGVLWLPASVPQPGVVRRGNGNRLVLGEPDGSRSARVTRLAAALEQAGIEAPVTEAIRQEMWVKLWGNLSFSLVAVLTRDTLEGIGSDPGTRAIVAAMMREAQAVGEALGIRFPITVEQRVEESRRIGPHKPSMLQDIEAGRPMEIEAITGVIAELARLLNLPVPTIDLILALVRSRARTAGV